MVGNWHHRLNGHEFEQTPGDGEGQGSLVCCSSWGCKELDMTEQLNNNKQKLKPQKTSNPVRLLQGRSLLPEEQASGEVK